MELVEFPEHTLVFARNQPQYRPLPAHLDNEGRMTCCWRLSWRERFRVLWTGRIWHQVLTFHSRLQPQLLDTRKPIFRPVSID